MCCHDCWVAHPPWKETAAPGPQPLQGSPSPVLILLEMGEAMTILKNQTTPPPCQKKKKWIWHINHLKDKCQEARCWGGNVGAVLRSVTGALGFKVLYSLTLSMTLTLRQGIKSDFFGGCGSKPMVGDKKQDSEGEMLGQCCDPLACLL